jgi:hypothetical protein
MLKDEIEEKKMTIKKGQKETRVNWVNLPNLRPES